MFMCVPNKTSNIACFNVVACISRFFVLVFILLKSSLHFNIKLFLLDKKSEDIMRHNLFHFENEGFLALEDFQRLESVIPFPALMCKHLFL